VALRILAGSRPHRTTIEPSTRQVRPTGIEQRSDPVVLEVAELEGDAPDAFDQVVEGFGGSVGHSRQVEVGDLVEPGPESAMKSNELLNRCCEIPRYSGQNATMPIKRYAAITTAVPKNPLRAGRSAAEGLVN